MTESRGHGGLGELPGHSLVLWMPAIPAGMTASQLYLITPFSQPPPSHVSAMGPGVQAQGARKRGRAGVHAWARAFFTAGPRAGLQRVILPAGG